MAIFINNFAPLRMLAPAGICHIHIYDSPWHRLSRNKRWSCRIPFRIRGEMLGIIGCRRVQAQEITWSRSSAIPLLALLIVTGPSITPRVFKSLQTFTQKFTPSVFSIQSLGMPRTPSAGSARARCTALLRSTAFLRVFAHASKYTNGARRFHWPVSPCAYLVANVGGGGADAHFSSINRAIRGNVHSSVAKPAASDSAFSTRTNSSRWDSQSRSGRPKCSARRSASSPPWLAQPLPPHHRLARYADSPCNLRLGLAGSQQPSGRTAGVAPAPCASVSVSSVPRR